MTIHVPGMLTRTHKKSSVLYLQGETCEGLFIVLDGVVALSTAIDLNRQVRVVRCRKGSMLGLAETIRGGPYQTTATAITDGHHAIRAQNGYSPRGRGRADHRSAIDAGALR